MNNETISGIVADLKVVPTRTGISMVTFVIGDKSCKAFGDVAATLQTLNEEQVQITAKPGTYRGKPEYAVVSVNGTVEGRKVSVSDIRKAPPPAQTPEKPLEEGMVRWCTRPGEREEFRRRVAWCGDAQLLELFERLPHPVCRKEDYVEITRGVGKHDRAVLEEFFTRNEFTESERHDYIINFGANVVDDKSLNYFWKLQAANGKPHSSHSPKPVTIIQSIVETHPGTPAP